MNLLTVYSTPTCAPCRTAMGRLDRENIAYTKVDLTEDPEALATLKRRLNSPVVHTPTFGFRGELYSIAGLRDIIAEIKAAGAAG